MAAHSKKQHLPQQKEAGDIARSNAQAPANHRTLSLQRTSGNQVLRRLLGPNAGGREAASSASASTDFARADGLTEQVTRLPASRRTDIRLQQHSNEGRGQFPAIQKKSLEVSHPTDADEKEADEVARKVVDGQSAEINETAGAVNRKGEGAAETTPEFHSKLKGSKGDGRPLDDATRSEMESKMGADFSRVSIHTGSDAIEMSKEIRAKAFTHGTDIYFNAGNYNPSSSRGRSLLAHELAHTIQQTRRNLSKHGSPAGVRAQRIMRSPDKFAEATKGGDARTFYVRGESRVNKIKQILAKADILFEGSPTKAYLVMKKQKGQPPTQYYQGQASTTSATPAAVKKVFDAIVPVGGEVYVTTDTFVSKLQTVVDAFRKSHPKTFSNLQVLSVLNQAAIIVNVKKAGSTISEKSCIETMNKCIENLHGSEKLKKSELSDTAFGTIAKLQSKKLVGNTAKVSLNYTGTGRFQIRMANIENVTKFAPKTFAQTLIDLTNNKEDGFYVYVCSLLNGYHSIIIVVKKQKGKFRFEWKDQDKDHGSEFDVGGLHKEFFGYAAGRYSWRIRERYQKEYGGSLPATYESISDDDKLKKVEELERPNIIADLKETTIAPLNP